MVRASWGRADRIQYALVIISNVVYNVCTYTLTPYPPLSNSMTGFQEHFGNNVS